ncbi:MAG: hypothetical protein JXA60_07980 [Candidatus Coatesbacteria bacterium]|nr:hypothetical protein [Candidatus Coatesbacteria bacterium]
MKIMVLIILLLATTCLISANVKYYAHLGIPADLKQLYSKGFNLRNQLKKNSKKASYKCVLDKNGIIREIVFTGKKTKKIKYAKIRISYKKGKIDNILFLNSSGKPVDAGPQNYAKLMFLKKKGKLVVLKYRARNIKKKKSQKTESIFNINSESINNCKGGT